MTERLFPRPWTVEQIPGGLRLSMPTGEALAYVNSRNSPADAGTAGVLPEDEARRIASNIAKLPELLGVESQLEQRMSRLASGCEQV